MKIVEKEIKVPTKTGKIKNIKQYTLYPNEDHILKNKITGLVIRTFIVVQSQTEIANYEEIED